jgi:uncharacterized membrane protein YcaP (DUF421 family)
MFFDSWTSIFRVIVVGVLAYAGIVFLVRISGKRTLAKMSAFDLLVTVALGSTLATILLSKDVALAEGLTAFGLLISLQYIVASLSIRSNTIRKLVKSDPRLLFYQGHFIDSALKAERVTVEEVYAAIRAQGISQLAQVEAVVLETDGSFTALPLSDGKATSLATVAIGGDEGTL